MRAGWLRHRVTIEVKNVLRDAYGGEIVSWDAVATVWAGVEPLRGRELMEARQEQALTTTQIRMRHRRDVRPEMRVVWFDEMGEAHLFDVQSVIHTFERMRETILLCQEVI